MKFKPWARLLWVVGIVALAALHAIHLRADFPNFTRWMDWSKYTDEGWYGNAAIQYHLTGNWYAAGDFNTAAALPVWPFLAWILFFFTGVGVQAARGLAVAIFFCNLLLTYRLIRTQADRPEGQRWVALLATTLVAASSFLYCFSRLAILEPLLICLTLSSLILAYRLSRARTPGRRIAIAISIGVLYALMILTKTTAIFLLPAIVYSIWYPQRHNLRGFLRSAGIVAAAALVSWGGYFLLLVRPRYLYDYHYLFLVNVYTKPTTILGWIKTFWYSVHGALWCDRVLVVLAAALVILSCFVARSLWRNPVYVSSLLAIGGYFFFIGFHNNMQPRYYAVVAFFIFFVVAMATATLLASHKPLGIVALSIVIVAVALNVRETLHFARHPEYTFVNAAENLTRYIDQHPNGNRLLLSISDNDITLITHLPAICDDFGTLPLPDRIRKYQPGWYAAWNDLDGGTLEDLHTQYWLEQVATFPAFDDSDRNKLVLFKMHPLAPGQKPVDEVSVRVDPPDQR